MRIGLYVEERFYGNKIAQATAFAKFRAKQFNRPVNLERVDFDGTKTIIETFVNPETK